MPKRPVGLCVCYCIIGSPGGDVLCERLISNYGWPSHRSTGDERLLSRVRVAFFKTDHHGELVKNKSEGIRSNTRSRTFAAASVEMFV